MFIDGEDDENSISTGLFLSVFLEKYMVHLQPTFCSSVTETLALSCTASVGLGLLTLAKKRDE